MDVTRFVPAVVLISVVSLAGGEAGRAATVQPFTQAAFDASKQAGKPILVHIEASWCTTCAQQRPILAKLEAEPTYASLVVYNVDSMPRRMLSALFESRCRAP